MTNFWLIRMGEGGKYSEVAIKHNFIAIGWNNLEWADKYLTKEEMKAAVAHFYPEYSDAQLAAQAGQVSRFVLDMDDDDYVLMPVGSGIYEVGTVGPYYFEPIPTDNCSYKHRRRVKWLGLQISKEDISSNLMFALGSTLTIYSLNKYESELRNHILGESNTPAEKPLTVRQAIKDGLLELNGEEFEHFIKHILSIVGFKSEVTQYVGDKGIDVVGTLDAEGLADITLRVQVKRLRSSIGNKEILSIRGAAAQNEHPCIITLSTFTKQAQEEAEAPGKTKVKLIDGDDLAVLVLRYFDDIDDEYKKRFVVRRKKDFNIDDQFEIPGLEISDESAEIEPTEPKPKTLNVDYDTMVCSAKEDGFKRAFIEQNAWWAVRMGEEARGSIKYLAMYRVAPISAITHVARVKNIEPYGDKGKFKLFVENIEELEHPIGLGENTNLKPQGPKYTKIDKLRPAKTLDDIFG